MYGSFSFLKKDHYGEIMGELMGDRFGENDDEMMGDQLRGHPDLPKKEKLIKRIFNSLKEWFWVREI